MIRVGAQLSLSRGIAETIEEARQAALNSLQIFSRSPVGGQSRGLPNPAEMAQWLAGANIRPLFVHAPYFVNPAAVDPAMVERAHQVLGDEMLRVKHLTGDFLVIHPGHRQGATTERDALDAFSRTVLHLLSKPGRILIENASGQGKEIGARFEALARILGQIGPTPRVGIMLDTAHAMAYGHPLSTEEDWHHLCAVIRDTVGLSRIKGVHLNDTAYPVASRRDRHAALLTGCLTASALGAIIQTADEYQWPLILETPGKTAQARSEDLQIIASIAKEVL